MWQTTSLEMPALVIFKDQAHVCDRVDQFPFVPCVRDSHQPNSIKGSVYIMIPY